MKDSENAKRQSLMVSGIDEFVQRNVVYRNDPTNDRQSYEIQLNRPVQPPQVESASEKIGQNNLSSSYYRSDDIPLRDVRVIKENTSAFSDKSHQDPYNTKNILDSRDISQTHRYPVTLRDSYPTLQHESNRLSVSNVRFVRPNPYIPSDKIHEDLYNQFGQQTNQIENTHFLDRGVYSRDKIPRGYNEIRSNDRSVTNGHDIIPMPVCDRRSVLRLPKTDEYFDDTHHRKRTRFISDNERSTDLDRNIYRSSYVKRIRSFRNTIDPTEVFII